MTSLNTTLELLMMIMVASVIQVLNTILTMIVALWFTMQLIGENVLSDKDYAYACHCGSVSFNLRKDYVIECHNCQSETNFSWNVKNNAVNTHIECCASCVHFSNLVGICGNGGGSTTSDDYCGHWSSKYHFERGVK